jgi:GNAT superfamily N-acetyltransferase
MSVIRPATANDVPAILQMIHDLAIYEKEPDAVRNTPEMLSEVLFGENPRVFAAMAENEAGDVRGFALWFLNYSTWEGVHGIYLEDLYVRPEARGSGVGRLLLRTLAEICVEHGYPRLEWWVLDWNPARDFYAAIGADALTEWIPYRMDGDALRRLAGR